VSVDCPFLVAPLVFSSVSVYCVVFIALFVFVLCFVYPMLVVSLDCPPKGQSRMDNPEPLATLGTQDTGRRQTKQINVRENRRGNEEWTIQRNYQHWVRPVSCVPNVASGSGLSILDCPFGFL
jgi:hypothetical protein